MNDYADIIHKKMALKYWLRMIISGLVVIVIGSFFGRIGLGVAVAISMLLMFRPIDNMISKAMFMKPLLLNIIVGIIWGIGISIIIRAYIIFSGFGLVLIVIVYLAGLYFSIINYDVLGKRYPIKYGFNYLNYSSMVAYVVSSLVLWGTLKSIQ
jgi:hypothetical protein